jgi:hypothetical protein
MVGRHPLEVVILGSSPSPATMENKEGKIDFNNPDGSVINTGDYSGEIAAGEWQEIADGVRCRTWEYKDVSKETVDGALVEIMPGHRTPVQFVESDHVFEENFQTGKFLVIYIDQENDLSVYKYDASIEPASFSLNVNQGEFMCIYALKENNEPGEIIECEQPGFISAKLATVDLSMSEIGGKQIPKLLREVIEKLDNKEEDDLPIEIVDVNEEM